MFNLYDCMETRRLVYPKAGTYKTRDEAKVVEKILLQEARASYSKIATCDADGNPMQGISTRIILSGDGFLVEAIMYDRLEDLDIPFPTGFEYMPSYEGDDICDEEDESEGGDESGGDDD